MVERTSSSEEGSNGKAAFGVAGLDDILGGGLTRNRLYLLEGEPGTGKTTLALQFLMEGAKSGERGLYVTLSETQVELRQSSASHGWKLSERIEIFELIPPESLLDADQQQSILYSSDLELGETIKAVFQAFERTRPARLVIDSLSELRLLSGGSLRYRRQILGLKHYFSQHGSTVLMLDDKSADVADKSVHSIAHGVVSLEELAPDYGAERRRLRVRKYRGQRYRGGYHDMAILTGGVAVFPRLVSLEHKTGYARNTLTSGIAEFDALLGGGVQAGSSTLILGPTGAGKSLIALQFALAAVERGEKAAVFVFDEELGVLSERVRGMDVLLERHIANGSIYVEQIDAAELSPGEFAHRVRALVDEQGIKTVVIDSLNGYRSAMPHENALILHMHELLQYLNRQGAATFLTIAQHGLVGDMQSPVDVTYLADSVILLRYFENMGRVRRAISVIKKRAGAHEDTIREYRINGSGLSIGEPLVGFQGVLRGVPSYVGDTGDQPLMDLVGQVSRAEGK
jgi:circadian clock protein KaiC